MALEFEIDGKQYKSGPLDAFSQLFVSKRIAPFLGALAPVAGMLRGEGGDVFSAIDSVLKALSKMPDEDLRFIIETSLSVVYRKQGEAAPWAKIISPGGKLMFDDIGLLAMNEITFYVLKDNLSDFFDGVVRRGWIAPN